MARDRYSGAGGQGTQRGRSRGSRSAQNPSNNGIHGSSRHERTNAYQTGSRAARRGLAARDRAPRAGGRGDGSGTTPPRQPRGGRPQTDLFHSDLAHERIPRRTVVFGTFAALLGLGVWQLADYQIVEASTYRDRADQYRVLEQEILAKRGTIYDRNGNVLTSSVECQNVYVNPQLIEDADEAVAALVEVLGVDEDTCRESVTSDTTFVYIKRQVDEEDAETLEEYGIAGIEFEQTVKRVYPYENLASQVLGVVNIDNEGVSGLESYYDEKLTGTNGSIVRERGADGSYIAGGAYKKVAAQDGTDLVLTLDVNIQATAEEALADAVESAEASNGSIIVMDPTTGEILACASSPTYYQTDLANTTAADMNLRMVTDSYEPGSVFKTLVASMGIDLGLLTPDSTFEVPAQVQVGDNWVVDVDERDYAMTMTLREILRRSSNTGMVLVGETIGADGFAEYLDTFGIGQTTGIDFPGESSGIVRDRSEYDGSTLGSMSFGQGISVPPVKIAQAVSSIANGGVMCTPHFLKSIHGEEIDWSDGDEQVISAETAEDVTSMMVTVVDEGTGEGGAIDGYDVAGKTGTAQRADDSGGYQADSYMASFLAFAPASDPKVLVYATLDGTPYMSYMASPAVKTTMEKALSVLGVEPTRTTEE